MKIWAVASLVVVLVVVFGHSALAVCSGSDCVNHELGSQSQCTEVTRRRTSDCRWVAGLDTNADYIIEGGDIVAYQIQWFSGAWSGWFVTGVNDIDWKYNTVQRSCAVPYLANHMRRVWSYFFDHTHKYIICKHRSDYSGPKAPCDGCPTLVYPAPKLQVREELPREEARTRAPTPAPIPDRPRGGHRGVVNEP
eukprot:scpid84834/ scgid32447/ 